MNDQNRLLLLKTIIENHVDGILLVNDQSEILFSNQAVARIFCQPVEQLRANPFQYPLKTDGTSVIQFVRPSGDQISLEMSVIKTRKEREPIFLVTLHDITDRMQAEEHMRLTEKVFENTAEGIFITDADSQIILINQAFTDITGYMATEVTNKEAQLFHSEQRDPEFFRQMWSALTITGQWQGEIWNRRKDGDIYPEWMTISLVRDKLGNPANYIAVFTDISTRKNAEERLRFLATHDPLTALPNRDLFQDRLDQALMRSRRLRAGKDPKWIVAVMLLDLDNFKVINDTHGHPTGDQVLVAVAERLLTCVRKSDSVARLGGDEFTIILEGLADPQNCSRVAQKVLDSLAVPMRLGSKEFQLHASLGISLYPEDGEDVETLLKHADIAMYHAKETHNCYQFYQLEGEKTSPR